jgi:hypothetical protein
MLVGGWNFNDFFNDFSTRQLSGTNSATIRRVPGCERESGSVSS